MSRQGRGVSAGLCCGGQRGVGERAERGGTCGICRLLDPHVSQTVTSSCPFLTGPGSVALPDWSVWFGRVACSREALPRVSAPCEFLHGPGGLCVLGALGQGAQEDEPEKPGKNKGSGGAGCQGAQVAAGALQTAGGAWQQRRGSATPQGLRASRVALVSLMFSGLGPCPTQTPRTAARPAFPCPSPTP